MCKPQIKQWFYFSRSSNYRNRIIRRSHNLQEIKYIFTVKNHNRFHSETEEEKKAKKAKRNKKKFCLKPNFFKVSSSAFSSSWREMGEMGPISHHARMLLVLVIMITWQKKESRPKGRWIRVKETNLNFSTFSIRQNIPKSSTSTENSSRMIYGSARCDCFWFLFWMIAPGAHFTASS